MKEKLKNLPFVIKVVLSFLIAILLFVSILLWFSLLLYFGLGLILTIINIIGGIIVITIFSAIIYYSIFTD